MKNSAARLSLIPLLGFLVLKIASDNRSSAVLGSATIAMNEKQEYVDVYKYRNLLTTTTAFDIIEETEEQEIPYETKFEEDSTIDYGVEEVKSKGVPGKTVYTYRLTKWQDELIDKTLINTKTINPKTEIVTKGTKITWKLYATPDVGRVKYWHSLKVFATKYDANCEGCTGRTFSGTEVKKGVCATDPKVIPLGTNFYVEGYGLCRAEDIGGLIKGNRIDLGYVDATKGDWRTGYTTIYLLTNPPYQFPQVQPLE